MGDDPTMYDSYNFVGLETRYIYDRRVDAWSIVNNVLLYDVYFGDGTQIEFVVHPEFNSIHRATSVVKLYAPEVGKLPAMLLKGLQEVWIMKGIVPLGGATGGTWGTFIYGNSLEIHTGMADSYKAAGVLVQTMVHEATHAVLDGTIYGDNAWFEAAKKDIKYISVYARDHPDREDAAETMLLYLAVEYKKDRLTTSDYNTIVNTIPHRIEYLNSLNYDVYPLKHSTGSPRWPLAGRISSSASTSLVQSSSSSSNEGSNNQQTFLPVGMMMIASIAITVFVAFKQQQQRRHHEYHDLINVE